MILYLQHTVHALLFLFYIRVKLVVLLLLLFIYFPLTSKKMPFRYLILSIISVKQQVVSFIVDALKLMFFFSSLHLKFPFCFVFYNWTQMCLGMALPRIC